MTDYTKFDALLIATIRGTKTRDGIVHFSSFAGRPDLSAMAASLATPDKSGIPPESWRVTDRRLQALRKAGKLTYDRKNGWSIA